ncbi:MAG: 6-hydroxycyclohex-1-ene-1-carbonyl-CoA dehydrogenase [Myxococcota bacterium]
MANLVGYALVETGSPLVRVERPLPEPGPGEVRVRVAGCGLCHTDLGFAFDGVRTRKPLPLVLGHEIAGVVDATGPDAGSWLGVAVVVPAVIPCGACDDCAAGAPMICKRQVMPGNDLDGGFASHVVVPARGLCAVPGADDRFDRVIGANGLTLRHLAVIADAASTPFQAVRRADVRPGDLAVVIGLGGVGGYAAQLARIAGAHVVGVDVSPERLAAPGACGRAFDPRALPGKELKAAIGAYAKEVGAPATRWKIFECSGSAAGQTTAFGLLVHGATLAVVGFTMDPVTVRLSNLMAFDARAIGNWGCPPDAYPEIVALALDGRLDVVGPTEIRPMDTLPGAFAHAHHHPSGRRIVFAPDRST